MLTDGMSLMSWNVTDVLSCLAHALATDKYRREGVRRSRAPACAAEPRPYVCGGAAPPPHSGGYTAEP